MSSKTIAPMLALAALGVVSLSACNTVQGAGQDIQQAGQTVEETAEDLNDGDPGTP
ncbi:MAG: entericidin A/B family lipoprotein [Hyphomonadaceae bacterium]|nr:entericidin A/B family lipoprotein [Hyphomonadaceae bacterium]